MSNDTRSGAGLVLAGGEAPQVHILIPLGYDMAAASNPINESSLSTLSLSWGGMGGFL